MNTHPSVDRDERTAALEKSGLLWAYNFLVFAVLIDVMYRGWRLHENAWDLLGIIVASGIVSWIYLVWHKALSRVLVVATVAAAVVAAVVGVVLQFVWG